jgi:hypothetical protein
MTMHRQHYIECNPDEQAPGLFELAAYAAAALCLILAMLAL